MEPYRLPAYPALLGDAAYLVALVLFLALQEAGTRLRAHEDDTWWASNGRDVVNGLAVTSLTGAIWVQGMALPLALLFGATLTLLLSSAHAFLAKRSVRPLPLVLVLAAVLGAPLLFAPAVLARGAARALEVLFPGLVGVE